MQGSHRQFVSQPSGWAGALAFALLLAACDPAGDNAQGPGGFTTALPSRLTPAALPTNGVLRAFVVVDGAAANRREIQISGNQASGVVRVTRGQHTFQVVFEFTDAGNATWEVARSDTVTLAASEGSRVQFDDANYTFANDDGDAFSNLHELEAGTDPGVFNSRASLASLTLSIGSLDPVFDPNQVDYTADVGFLASSVAITAAATDDDATIRIEGTQVASGEASAPIELNEGTNFIAIVVTGGDGSTQNYSVSITRANATDFAQQAYLKASNAEAGDLFGSTVALHGDTLVVGARTESGSAAGGGNDNNEPDAGAVYVFTRNAGQWTQQAYLKASNGEMDDNFGFRVAVDGDTLVASARFEDGSATGGGNDNTAPRAGAVYVFTRNAGVWSQQAYLKASNAEAGDQFGISIALQGDTLAVGAQFEDSSASGGENDNSASDAGAVYVFTRAAGVWTQEAYLKASNADAGDLFGGTVALDADTLVVGARSEDSSTTAGENDNSMTDAGAVYVFTRSAAVWTQQSFLKASNAEANDEFGFRVAVDSDTLAVSARNEDSTATGGENNNGAFDSGAAYVFTRSVNVWTQTAYLKASNAEADDFFGSGIALVGTTLVVVAQSEDSSATGGENDNSAVDSGAAYVFTGRAGTWAQQAYLKASNAGSNDLFGVTVALHGDTLVVGARAEDSSVVGGENDNSAESAGATYVWQ